MRFKDHVRAAAFASRRLREGVCLCCGGHLFERFEIKFQLFAWLAFDLLTKSLDCEVEKLVSTELGALFRFHHAGLGWEVLHHLEWIVALAVAEKAGTHNSHSVAEGTDAFGAHCL